MALNSRQVDSVRLEKQIAYLLNKHRQFGSRQAKIGSVGLEMLYIFGINGIEVPPDYALLAKAVLCVEETARALNPGFDIEEVARPFLQQMEKERWSQVALLGKPYTLSFLYSERCNKFPGRYSVYF